MTEDIPVSDSMSDETAPLRGVRVADLSRALAGPLAGSLLADFGADVIKVEPIGSGDPSRLWPPFLGRESLYFASVNRGKRSIAIDFRAREARDVLHRLISSSDVVIESFRPGVMQALGLDHSTLRRDFPNVVVMSISGYGSVGPDSHLPGFDQVIQGVSGIVSVTGADTENQVRVGVPIVDFLTGVHAALGATVGLVARTRTRAGMLVETSLLETSLSALVFQAQGYLSNGTVPEPRGNSHPTIAPYGAYATSTSPITVSVGTERQWAALTTALDLHPLLSDARFRTGRDRFTHRAQLDDILGKRFGERDAISWLDLLQGAGVPCGPINTVAQALDSPQVDALGIITPARLSDGTTTRILASPFRLGGERPPIRRGPPGLSHQAVAILEEIGFTEAEISVLVKQGIVAGDEVGGTT